MFSTKRILFICNLASVIDPQTGNRKKSVVDGKIVVCDKDLVGVQTQQLAQSQNMVFNNSLEIDRMFYNEQKYCYIDDSLYEIKTLTKGSKPNLMKLNIIANNDIELKQLIEEWINANL